MLPVNAIDLGLHLGMPALDQDRELTDQPSRAKPGGLAQTSARTGYVTRITGRTSHPLGAAPCLSLFAGAALGPGFSRGQLIDQELVAEHDLTGNPTEAAATFGLRSHGVAGECAAMGGAMVLLERTRTICIGTA